MAVATTTPTSKFVSTGHCFQPDKTGVESTPNTQIQKLVHELIRHTNTAAVDLPHPLKERPLVLHPLWVQSDHGVVLLTGDEDRLFLRLMHVSFS
jgi:hypothetical protein